MYRSILCHLSSRSPVWPKADWIVINSKRSYHSIKGIFGNYHPYQSSLEQWFRDMNDLSYQQLSPHHRLIIESFQKRGHLLCQLDPLSATKTIDLDELGLRKLGQVLGVDLERFLNEEQTSSQTLNIDERKDFLSKMLQMYCGYIGYEFSHLMSLKEIDWFEAIIQQENNNNNDHSNHQWKTGLAKQLLLTETLDHYLAKKFQSIKRYGCEGAETMIVFVQEIIRQLQQQSIQSANVDEIIIGMPHRGRLNLLVNLLQYPLEALFHKLNGHGEWQPLRQPKLIGDVISHLYTSVQLEQSSDTGVVDGDRVRCTLLPNPSHLEVVAPVVCGFARGQLLQKRLGPYDPQRADHFRALPLQIHGDASFAGQGIIMETLAMANVEHFTVGGSIHLVVNNQLGYTTPGRMHQARSSLYCTDPMKMINAPVIHVNGDHPEMVARAASIALNYRQLFRKDVAVNLVCFRRWGHNELDDPTFTNPQMYAKIGERESIPKKFARKIGMSQEETEAILNDYNQKLNEALSNAEQYQPPVLPSVITESQWNQIQWPSSDTVTKWDTSVPESLLRHIGQVSITLPASKEWNLHPTLKKVFNDRNSKISTGNNLDWALAESLAFGSLLYQGFDVRLCGQDVGRGTFSQRHIMIVDQVNNDVYVPLNDLIHHNQINLPWKHESFGHIEVCNSILSEEGVLAFEYGLSLTSPHTLVIWEAQFGDFFNGAQTIIDTLICSGEGKWLLPSSLTLLLPNGYDGAGPEHTSARMERFLQQSNSSEIEIDSDNVNWSVVYPTTPAQYFHVLRRQMNRPYRKPLVVMSPKMLLRHPWCVSSMQDMCQVGAHFSPVLDDPKFYTETPQQIETVRTILFCSGKHYFTLVKEIKDRFGDDKSLALIRVEELCPFPALELTLILKRYPKVKNLIWSQEEHRNMGAWSFIEPRFRNILHQPNLKYAGRGHLEAPATGIADLHKKQIRQLLNDTFELCKA